MQLKSENGKWNWNFLKEKWSWGYGGDGVLPIDVRVSAKQDLHLAPEDVDVILPLLDQGLSVLQSIPQIRHLLLHDLGFCHVC